MPRARKIYLCLTAGREKGPWPHLSPEEGAEGMAALNGVHGPLQCIAQRQLEV